MDGSLRRLLVLSMAALGLSSAVGCMGATRYHDLVDPCYPNRYSSQARASVIASVAPQVKNAHILNQTIRNYHFEYGTDKLHAGGYDKLDNLVRTRPAPDPQVFLQTARDLLYDPTEPQKYATARQDLDYRRKVAIEKYLMAQTASRPIAFEIFVHDPNDTAEFADTALLAMRRHRASAQGTLIGGIGGGGGVGDGGGGQGGQGGGAFTGGTGTGTGAATGNGNSGSGTGSGTGNSGGLR